MGGGLKLFVQYLFSKILRNSRVGRTISECALSVDCCVEIQEVGRQQGGSTCKFIKPFTTKNQNQYLLFATTFPVLTKANPKCERTQRTNFKSFGLSLEGYQFIFSCLAMLYINKYSFLFIFTFYSVDQVKICQVQIRKYKMALPY